ncbi:uncharacterized protein LOC119085150 [Bradysia coprophila]|uniref:uncharacterized protein LOC119085150 n=1 Tax=Bradysia coprophila TaxID=38358 RepID=UPI00187D9890|nr:uncharacterized protein LOC119085150 [Bradysia coprophila]
MMKIVVAVFLLFLIGKEVMSQDCNAKNDPCGNAKPCCAGAGVCKDQDIGVPLCQCTIDGYWQTCTSDAECCAGHCNSRGYCGCILSGNWCTEGKSEECCGKASSIDGHLIKTCASAWPLHHECY